MLSSSTYDTSAGPRLDERFSSTHMYESHTSHYSARRFLLIQWRRQGLWCPGPNVRPAAPPLLAQGPSRLIGVWGAPQRAYGENPGRRWIWWILKCIINVTEHLCLTNIESCKAFKWRPNFLSSLKCRPWNVPSGAHAPFAPASRHHCPNRYVNSKANKKVKCVYSCSWETHLRATGRHLPYGITQFYLPPDTSERASP